MTPCTCKRCGDEIPEQGLRCVVTQHAPEKFTRIFLCGWCRRDRTQAAHKYQAYAELQQ